MIGVIRKSQVLSQDAEEYSYMQLSIIMGRHKMYTAQQLVEMVRELHAHGMSNQKAIVLVANAYGVSELFLISALDTHGYKLI